eukprot:Platyproteum_vivax@DN6253_c0_g2_i1.p1
MPKNKVNGNKLVWSAVSKQTKSTPINTAKTVSVKENRCWAPTNVRACLFPRLGAAEWELLQQQAQRRQDLAEVCAICMEAFSCRQQAVLLSCSHMFHRSCLEKFENFALSKQLWRCALCRTPYSCSDSKYNGTLRERSAIQIQAAWRGFFVRKNILKTCMGLAAESRNHEKYWLFGASKVGSAWMKLEDSRRWEGLLCYTNQCVELAQHQINQLKQN